MEKHLDGKSFDNIQARIEELKRLFPEAVKEGRFDPELLVGLLEENDETYGLNEERYDFTWKGKAEALRLAQRRSDGTLRPCFEESRDWDTTQNLYIEGDNLEVMKLLQQGYLRSVKMIYIDPPYNTGNDFVYQDDFADPIAKYKEATGQGMRANPETAGRYHSNWLSMMYPRLKIAKTLLRDDGVIFISIDDNEVHNLMKLCDDVFGEENHLGTFIWKRRQIVDSRSKNGVSEDHEYLVCYGRTFSARLRGKDIDKGKYSNPDNDSRGVWMSDNMVGLATKDQRPNLHYDLVHPTTGVVYACPPTGWRYEQKRMMQLIADNEVLFPEQQTGRPRRKRFLADAKSEFTGFSTILDTAYNTQATREVRDIFDGMDYFDFPKPVDLVSIAVEQGASVPDAIVLDFFSGSGTTAQAVMQCNAKDGLNRQFICIQLPEPLLKDGEAHTAGFRTIADIGKERIRRAGDKILHAFVQSPDTHFPLSAGDGYGDGQGYGNGRGGGQGAGFGSVDGSGNLDRLDVGFRAFTLDSSNLQKWDGSYVPPENADLFLDRAEHSLDNMKPDRRDIDMVYEVFLKYGVPLTEKLATMQVQDKTFYVVGDTGYLMICLDRDITVEIVEETIKTHTPGAIIFTDECFVDDNELTNAGLALDKAQIEFKWI